MPFRTSKLIQVLAWVAVLVFLLATNISAQTKDAIESIGSEEIPPQDESEQLPKEEVTFEPVTVVASSSFAVYQDGAANRTLFGEE
jgi:hypothetical protein